LAALRDAGRALLVVTHDLDVVRALGGRLAVLEGGGITEAGSAQLLLADPGSVFLRACVAADPRRWPARRPHTAGTETATGEALVIARGGKSLAAPLEIALREGQITGVGGPSGLGKTTLGDTLLGLAPPGAGRIAWFGRNLDARRRRQLRARFQKLHQDPTTVFPAGRSFGASLSDLRRLPGGPDAARHLARILEQLHVSPALLNRRPFARLLALRPAMLVADEPCSRLDMPVRAETMRLLRERVDDGDLSVLLISHDAATLTAMADQVVTLRPATGMRLSS
jgi:peptide/nickel transport system ATP-binding protein